MVYAQIALKLLIGLFALILITRLLGKKEMSQLTPFDFIYALVLGGILEESIYDDKVSIWQVLFAVAVWGTAIYVIEVLTEKKRSIRKLLKGSPSLIIRNGELDLEQIRKNHLDIEQIRTMLRQQGIFSLREVRDLYLEPGGSISVNKHAASEAVTPDLLNIDAPDKDPSYLLIEDGEVREEQLYFAGKTAGWLYDELTGKGYSGPGDILYAEWSEAEGFYIKTFKESQSTS
ncbi:DUF421 domain-containing protein [Domibacillus indicus]|uniref:DUF421 domain-containing protein n=1 Tax=Domibacillus indicus TaxID=1437523 RepID=UPI000617FBA5|nr:DUF421 domain-containing protein [Domibacillus indicus]